MRPKALANLANVAEKLLAAIFKPTIFCFKILSTIICTSKTWKFFAKEISAVGALGHRTPTPKVPHYPKISIVKRYVSHLLGRWVHPFLLSEKHLVTFIIFMLFSFRQMVINLLAYIKSLNCSLFVTKSSWKLYEAVFVIWVFIS